MLGSEHRAEKPCSELGRLAGTRGGEPCAPVVAVLAEGLVQVLFSLALPSRFSCQNTGYAALELALG